MIEGQEPGEKYTTGDYTIDEKHKSAALTEEGVLKVEKLLGVGNLYDQANIEYNHHVQQALRAHVIYQRDRDYVVKDGDEGPEVIIVDEFTGRIMPGRRWSDGLHQAVEAKENVKIQRENQTLATITFQNYFRMYKKLAGMTGTAETEAAEFQKIYNLDVTVIPTNRPLIRKENQDMVYRTEVEKFRNAAKEIMELNERGQPVLVGTISVEKSERLSAILKRMGVKHEVLNAKNHEREASIVAQAGRKSAVTVSTNMAGRGTDILLGGNPEFMTKDACLKEKVAERLLRGRGPVRGRRAFLLLHPPRPVLPGAPRQMGRDLRRRQGADRHGTRRSGGSGRPAHRGHRAPRIPAHRQPVPRTRRPPGRPRQLAFLPSLQDDLLRIFGGERMQNLMLRLGMEEDVPIESKMITKRIAKAQEAVETQNFEARKHLLEYDDVTTSSARPSMACAASCSKAWIRKSASWTWCAASWTNSSTCAAPTTSTPIPGTWPRLRNDILSQFGAKIDIAELADLTRDEMSDPIYERLQHNTRRRKTWWAPTSCARPSASSCCRSSTTSGRTTCCRWTN